MNVRLPIFRVHFSGHNIPDVSRTDSSLEVNLDWPSLNLPSRSGFSFKQMLLRQIKWGMFLNNQYLLFWLEPSLVPSGERRDTPRARFQLVAGLIDWREQRGSTPTRGEGAIYRCYIQYILNKLYEPTVFSIWMMNCWVRSRLHLYRHHTAAGSGAPPPVGREKYYKYLKSGNICTHYIKSFSCSA